MARAEMSRLDRSELDAVSAATTGFLVGWFREPTDCLVERSKAINDLICLRSEFWIQLDHRM
jgi:hypothetical protein